MKIKVKTKPEEVDWSKTTQVELEIDGKSILVREHSTPNSTELLYYKQDIEWRPLLELEIGNEVGFFIEEICCGMENLDLRDSLDMEDE